MKPGGGKRKGSSFERKVCVALSLWLTKGKREDCFWRSAMSGGRATVRARKGKTTASQHGDVSAVTGVGEEFLKNLVIECKHVANLSILGAMLNWSGKLAKFWDKLSLEADGLARRPVLIARQTNMPTLLFMLPDDAVYVFGVLRTQGSLWSPRWGEIGIYKFDEVVRVVKSKGKKRVKVIKK